MNLDGGVLQFYKQFTKMCFPRINKKKSADVRQTNWNESTLFLFVGRKNKPNQKKIDFFWDRVDGGGTLEIRDAWIICETTEII